MKYIFKYSLSLSTFFFFAFNSAFFFSSVKVSVKFQILNMFNAIMLSTLTEFKYYKILRLNTVISLC